MKYLFIILLILCSFTMDNEQVGKYIRLLCLQHQKGKSTEADRRFREEVIDETSIIVHFHKSTRFTLLHW